MIITSAPIAFTESSLYFCCYCLCKKSRSVCLRVRVFLEIFIIMREFSVLFLLITTLSSSQTWIDVKKKKKKSRWHFKEFNNPTPYCTAWSVFHILKLLAPGRVMAKLADTILGYSRCHNSSYLASDVKEDKVLLRTYTKLLCIVALVHKEKKKKEKKGLIFSKATTMQS